MNQNTKGMSLCVLLLLLLFLFAGGAIFERDSSLYVSSVLEAAEENAPVDEATKGAMKGMKHLAEKGNQRRAALEKLAQKPLTDVQQKLLRQLLKTKDAIDDVLSSAPYLAYLKAKVGKAYPDFPAYVAAMPTPKRKIAVLFTFQEAFSPETTAKELQIFVRYYFALRGLFAKKGLTIRDTDEFREFETAHLIEPYAALVQADFKNISFPLFFKKMMQMAVIPDTLATMHTEVFHNAWRERLEKHGPREGLLQCAIATPGEFALARSFFEDTAAFEKWIVEPLEVEKESEEKEEKVDR